MISEKKYHELVAVWLYESFADVEHEITIASGNRPDFIVSTPYEDYVVEVANDQKTIRMDMGQVIDYASELGMTPIVVIPADAVEEPQFSRLNESELAPIIETV